MWRAKKLTLSLIDQVARDPARGPQTVWPVDRARPPVVPGQGSRSSCREMWRHDAADENDDDGIVGLPRDGNEVLFPFAAIGGALFAATIAGAILGAVVDTRPPGRVAAISRSLATYLDDGFVVVGVSEMKTTSNNRRRMPTNWRAGRSRPTLQRSREDARAADVTQSVTEEADTED